MQAVRIPNGTEGFLQVPLRACVDILCLLFCLSWLPPANAPPRGGLFSFVVFGSVVCSPPAFRVSISGCRMFDMWTVTILIYDVWTLHSCPRADCSTLVPECYTYHLQMMMRPCVSRLCWHVSPCVSPGGLQCRYLSGGCTRRRQSSVPLDWCLVHFAALRERLRELWKVCEWVEAVVLDGEAVGEYFFVVGYDLSACNPALD